MRIARAVGRFGLLLVLVRGLPLPSAAAAGDIDALDGPLVQDARAALARNDPAQVLKWVPANAEDEVKRSFQAAADARAQDPETRYAAEHKFFEALLRLHCAGAGVPFTGVKPEGTPVPGADEADQALDRGSVQPLLRSLMPKMFENAETRFDRVLQARKHQNEGTAAGREYVAAYLDYVRFIEKLTAAVAGGGSRSEPRSR